MSELTGALLRELTELRRRVAQLETLETGTPGAEGSVPSGAMCYFAADPPPGWTEYAAARGRVIVGVPEGGTVAGTVGSALADLTARTITDVPAHSHGAGTLANGSQSASHTHSGTTGNPSANHTHSWSGTTGNPSANHTHSLSSHTHSFSDTSSGPSNNTSGGPSTASTGNVSAGHTHTINAYTSNNEAAGYGLTPSSSFQNRVLINTTGGQASSGISANHTHSMQSHTHSLQSHTHSVSGTTSGPSTANTGTVSAWHTHDVSGTTGGQSANHTHDVTTGSQSASHTHTISGSTAAEGVGAVDATMPYIQLRLCQKT